MTLNVTPQPSSPAGEIDHDDIRLKQNAIIADAMPAATANNAYVAQGNGSQWQLMAVTGANRAFVYDAVTTAGDPGAGKVRMNSTDLSLVTEIYVSATTTSGINFGSILKVMRVGDRGVLNYFNDQTMAIQYRLTLAPVDNGTWFTITIAVDDSNGTFTDATILSADIYAFGLPELEINVVTTTEFTQVSPVAGTVYDTGYDPTGKASSERVGVSLLVTSGGIQRGVLSSVRASTLIAFPNVRIARTTEFTSAPGDVTMEFWFDNTTTPGAPTVKAEIEVDGGGKTLDSLIAVSSFEQIVIA